MIKGISVQEIVYRLTLSYCIAAATASSNLPTKSPAYIFAFFFQTAPLIIHFMTIKPSDHRYGRPRALSFAKANKETRSGVSIDSCYSSTKRVTKRISSTAKKEA